jgi:hypothetical protein
MAMAVHSLAAALQATEDDSRAGSQAQHQLSCDYQVS